MPIEGASAIATMATVISSLRFMRPSFSPWTSDFVIGCLTRKQLPTGRSPRKQMSGLMEYGAAFAGLEPDKTSPLLLSAFPPASTATVRSE
jgi:hypothetical protein